MLDIHSGVHAFSDLTDGIAARRPSAQPIAAPNHLTGFDMVWAITQNTVNSQLQWLQESGLIPRAVKIGDLEVDGIAIGGDGEDEATIAPPVVSFDTGTPKTARLVITITGGNVSYYSGFGAKQKLKKCSVAGWKLAFNVNLNIAQIAHESIENGCAIPKEIADILKNFDESMFGIQSIFLDFENSDMVNYDTKASFIPCEDVFVVQNFATSMGAWMTGHKGTGNPFVLGYPVSRKAPVHNVVAVFEPTGATMSTHAFESGSQLPDANLDGLSTLNFLLVTGQRNILDEPALRAADAGSFHRNLVCSNDIDGKGIISRDLFLNNYIRPLIVDELLVELNEQPDYIRARMDRWNDMNHDEIVNEKSGVGRHDMPGTRATFVATPTGWSYRDHVKLSWHESGSHSHDRESEQELVFTVDVLTAPDDTGAQRLTIAIHGSVRRYEWDQLNVDMPFKSNVYVGKGWASTTLAWELRVQLVAGDEGKIKITSKATKKDPVQESGTGGAYQATDLFSGLLGLDTIAHDWENNAGNLGSVEDAVVNSLIERTEAALAGAATRVVLPARSTFFYKNIQLNADGDVEVDLAYKSAS